MIFPCTVITRARGKAYEVQFDAERKPVEVKCIVRKGMTRLTWHRGIMVTDTARAAIRAAYVEYPALVAQP